MTPFLRSTLRTAGAALCLGLIAVPASGQLGGRTTGPKFLQAVRDENNNDVVAALNELGTTLVNSRDYNSRETALHIAARSDNAVYVRFFLQKGADPNLQDRDGNTPLMVAVNSGHGDLIEIFVAARADVNKQNNSGETPLIRAVQRRDLSMTRELLAAGADADQADSLAGKSARAYAEEDVRTPALAKLFADIPKRDRRAVSGPKL